MPIGKMVLLFILPFGNPKSAKGGHPYLGKLFPFVNWSRTKYSIWYPFYNYCTSKTFSNEFQAFREETLKSTYYFHKNWILSKNELGPTLLSLKTFSNECQTFRKETEQIIFSRGIQQLRGQNCAIFCPPPPCVDIFHTLSVDKNRHLTFDPLPPSSCPRSYWMTPYSILTFGSSTKSKHFCIVCSRFFPSKYFSKP